MSIIRRPVILIVAVVATAFLVIQLVRPERSNPPIDPARAIESHVTIPADVAAIFERSCRDCHTYDTRWPWYSAVAPASWLVAYDVREGRDELNLSEWAGYDFKKADHLLEEVCEEAEKGAMPPAYYRWLHPGARLSSAEVARLCEWTHDARREAAARKQPAVEHTAR